MFNNLANYLLGYSTQDPAPQDRDIDVRLTAVMADDDDWVLVDKDRYSDCSPSNSLSSSLESLPDAHAFRQTPHHPLAILITRTSSTSSLPCAGIEESWFLTPPPCFMSAGPVHMETSPLENLLIEHPSMSVYQHSVTQPAAITRRHNSAPSSSGNSSSGDLEEEEAEVELLVERREERVVRNRERRVPVDSLRQQERQCLKIKNAQKVQIHKACQSLKRGYFERNNKAREVNCRNHRQRRGERSQGLVRSNANNNRKC